RAHDNRPDRAGHPGRIAPHFGACRIEHEEVLVCRGRWPDPLPLPAVWRKPAAENGARLVDRDQVSGVVEHHELALGIGAARWRPGRGDRAANRLAFEALAGLKHARQLARRRIDAIETLPAEIEQKQRAIRLPDPGGT